MTGKGCKPAVLGFTAHVANAEISVINIQRPAARAHRPLQGTTLRAHVGLRRVVRCRFFSSPLKRLIPHCHMIETGNESYRFKNSAAKIGKEVKRRKAAGSRVILGSPR